MGFNKKKSGKYEIFGCAVWQDAITIDCGQPLQDKNL